MDRPDDKNSKKGGANNNLTIPKDLTRIKSGNIKENRTGKIDLLSKFNKYIVLVVSTNIPTVKDVKNVGAILDDQMTPEAPKMIIFATISHLAPTRISSYSETADRSERLRRYNLNETYSTSVLLTTIRDIPLEPPPSSLPTESIPAWKLIRPRKPKVVPHAEPIGEYQ